MSAARPPSRWFGQLADRLTLRAQIAILIAVAMLPVGAVAVTQGIASYFETRELREAALSREALDASRREGGEIKEAFGALKAVDAVLDVAAPAEECSTLMEALVKREDSIPFAGFVSSDGVMRCGYPLAAPVDVKSRPEYQRFLTDPRRMATAYDRGPLSGRPVLLISAPVLRDGILLGTLNVSISSTYLDWVRKLSPLDTEARHALITSMGKTVAQHNPDEPHDWLPPDEALDDILKNSDAIHRLKARNGEQRVYISTPVFAGDVFTVASWPAHAAMDSLGLQTFLSVMMPLIMWILAAGVAYFAVDQLALRHILYLDRVVRQYDGTDQALRTDGLRGAPREIAQLGASFDRMADRVEAREADLREALDEKTVLLKEVYHRVKNNLQLIVSLMSLQSREARDERERAGLRRLQDRVQGLSLVHRKLYEAQNLHAVQIDELLEEIALNIKGARSPNFSDIKLKFDVDPVVETPERAVPIALFVTEAIVNAFKHSWAVDDAGWLTVTFKDRGDHLALSIANDISPDAPPPPEPGGLGSQLIEGFARQLRAQIERQRTPTDFALHITIPKATNANSPDCRTG